MWWPNHIVLAHVSKVAKNIACCVWKTSQDCISVYMLWRFEIWENYSNSNIIIFKAFWSFYFSFSLHILFKQIMQGHIRERKEIPNDGKHVTFQFCYAKAHKCYWHCTFAMPKHTGVILWLAGNSGEMVIYAFLLGFSSPSIKKSDTNVKYKR